MLLSRIDEGFNSPGSRPKRKTKDLDDVDDLDTASVDQDSQTDDEVEEEDELIEPGPAEDEDSIEASPGPVVVKKKKQPKIVRAGRFESGEYWRTDGMLCAGGVSARSARLDWTPGAFTREEKALFRREMAARCARRGM